MLHNLETWVEIASRSIFALPCHRRNYDKRCPWGIIDDDYNNDDYDNDDNDDDYDNDDDDDNDDNDDDDDADDNDDHSKYKTPKVVAEEEPGLGDEKINYQEYVVPAFLTQVGHQQTDRGGVVQITKIRMERELY